MRVKKAIKKIAALGVGAAMMGATLTGALAQNFDLADYPGFLIDEESGSFNGVLSVGAGAKAEDVIGITNIATSLQSVSVKKTAVDAGSADGDVETVVVGSEAVELGDQDLYYGTKLSSVEDSIDDTELPELFADGFYHDSEGDVDNDETYDQELKFRGTSTGLFLYSQDDDDAPIAGPYLFIDDNGADPFYEYKLEFDEDIEFFDVGDDFEGTTLFIQGREYTITNADFSNGALTELEMQAGDVVVWVTEGETFTREVDGVEHTIEFLDVTSDATEDTGACGFRVDGVTVWVDVDDTETVSGLTLGVVDAKAINIEAEDQDVCQVVVGANEITLKNGTELEINDEDLDGSDVNFTLTRSANQTSGTKGLWRSVSVTFAPEDSEGFDEVYLAPGDEYVDPVFGNWKLIFSAIEGQGWETIEFESSGDDGSISFFNEDGQQVILPITADDDSTLGSGAQNAKERIFWGTEAPTSSDAEEDNLLYLEGETCTGSSGSITDCNGALFLVVNDKEAHVIEINSIDTGNATGDTSSGEIDFKDLTYSSEDKDEPYTNEAGTNSFQLGADAGTVVLNINEAAGTITFTSTMEDSGTTGTDPFNATYAGTGSFVETLEEGFLIFLNNDTSNQVFDGMVFAEGNDGDLNDSAYFGGPENNGRLVNNDTRGTTSVSSLVADNLNLIIAGFYDDSDDDQIEFAVGTVGDITANTTGTSPTAGNFFAGSEAIASLNGQRKGGLGVNDTGYGDFDLDDTSDGNDWEVFVTRKGTVITRNDQDDDYVSIEHPHDAVYASVYIAPTSAGTETVLKEGSVREEVIPISVGAVQLDTEITDATNKNLVIVGGPCAHSVVAQFYGNPGPDECVAVTGLQNGQALIKLFENGENVAVVVAGLDAVDSRRASEVLANAGDYGLEGDEMLVTTITSTPTVAKPSAAPAVEEEGDEMEEGDAEE